MLKVTICSARDLKYWERDDLKCLGRDSPFRPFAVVYVDNNEQFSTEVDEKGDRCPSWGATQSFSLGRPINDDTTLRVDIVDAGKDEPNREIGSASLKLMKVVKDVGYGQLAKRTLKLKRNTGRSRGHVNVEVSITEPSTAQPVGRPPKKTNEFPNGWMYGLEAANDVSNTVQAVQDFVEGIFGSDEQP